MLLCGSSGCGKTTVARLVNGLIPHYYKGELSGVYVLSPDIIVLDEPSSNFDSSAITARARALL